MAVAVWAVGATVAAADVLNGTFDSGLSDWVVEGDVTDDSGAARLGDSGAEYSLLYQGVALGPGAYALQFDFLNGLSDEVLSDPFTFPDAFFASLYFIDDLAAFDLATLSYDAVHSLLDLDATGPYNVHGQGLLSASPLGAGWTRFRYSFLNSHAYALPTFEFFNLNGLRSDSAVLVDNVTIEAVAPPAVVPEPASLILMVAGVLAGAALRRRACRS